MNLILTPLCNKNCKNCFAKGYRNSEKENLDLEFLNKFPEWDKESSPDIGLLGGEPTLNPLFFNFIEKLWDLNYVPLVFSNFLFEEEFLAKLKLFILKNFSRDLKFLININELEEASFNKVLKNINSITKTLELIEKQNKLSLSLTLDPLENEKTLDYLSLLYKELDIPFRLRIGIALPSDLEKESLYKKYINNKKLGEIIVKILKWSLNQKIEIFWDCGIYPCFFSKEDLLVFETLYPKFEYKCKNAAFDILPSGHAIYCFPLKDQISSPIFLNKDVKINKSFIDFKKTEENLNKKFQKVEENLFCLDCRICEYYSSGICDGVCPALLKKDIAL